MVVELRRRWTAARFETALIVAGLLANFFLLQHKDRYDGHVRFDALSALLSDGHLVSIRYSLVGPLFATPLWFIGELAGNPMFAEDGGKVTLSGRSMSDGGRLVFEGDRVFVAAGALSTTKMVLESTEAYDRTVSMLDSQYFLVPWLRYRRTPGVADEPLHTLSQVMIEIFDEAMSRHSVHLQVYSYNDLYRQAIEAVVGRVFRPAMNECLTRLLLIQGYLHSDDSARIDLQLRPGGTLRLTPRKNPGTRRLLRKVATKLVRGHALTKAMPLPFMRVGEPGRGFHVGGTLPMRDRPVEFETDVWGRPRGFERVHLVDGSVLPTVNAGSITLTIMANAHRIAARHA